MHGDLHHHFARRGGRGTGVGAVGLLGADAVDIHAGEIPQLDLKQLAAHLLHHRVGRSPTLPGGVDAADHEQRGAAHAGRIGGADLVGRGGRIAPGAADAHLVLPGLLQPDPGEIADHIGQQVGARIADLVQHLLQHRMHRDQPTGAFRLADDELAAGLDFDDGETHVGVALAHQLPVGEVAAGALRAAFDDVARYRAGGELVVFVFFPTELVHQRAQHHGGVDAAPGDDDLRAGIQRTGDGDGAEVGVHRHQGGRHRLATVQLGAVGEFLLARQQVVAQHHADLDRHAGLGGNFLQRLLAGQRIDAAGIGHHLDAARLDLAQQRRHHVLDEVGGITVVGIAHTLGGENRHGDLGEVVENQVIDITFMHQLRRGGIRIAPEGGGAADAHGFLRSGHFLLVLTGSGSGITPSWRRP